MSNAYTQDRVCTNSLSLRTNWLPQKTAQWRRRPFATLNLAQFHFKEQDTHHLRISTFDAALDGPVKAALNELGIHTVNMKVTLKQAAMKKLSVSLKSTRKWADRYFRPICKKTKKSPDGWGAESMYFRLQKLTRDGVSFDEVYQRSKVRITPYESIKHPTPKTERWKMSHEPSWKKPRPKVLTALLIEAILKRDKLPMQLKPVCFEQAPPVKITLKDDKWHRHFPDDVDEVNDQEDFWTAVLYAWDKVEEYTQNQIPPVAYSHHIREVIDAMGSASITASFDGNDVFVSHRHWKRSQNRAAALCLVHNMGFEFPENEGIIFK